MHFIAQIHVKNDPCRSWGVGHISINSRRTDLARLVRVQRLVKGAKMTGRKQRLDLPMVQQGTLGDLQAVILSWVYSRDFISLR